MKTRRHILIALALALTFLMPCYTPFARSETYPIYTVSTRPALLYESPALTQDAIIYTVPIDEKVLVAGETDDSYLILTLAGYVGYIRKSSLKASGKTYQWDSAITEADIANNAQVHIDQITVDPLAILPEDADAQAKYPPTILLGEQEYDLEQIARALLGEGYALLPRDFQQIDKYESRDAQKPLRSIRVNYESYAHKELSYYDGMVTSERGAEYEPPRMNTSQAESLALCKALLAGMVDESWLAYPSLTRGISDHWSYADRWMTDSEYSEMMRARDSHYFQFEHRTPDGICVLDDGLTASVGMNGLAMMDLSWREIRASNGDPISPMPLSDAIEMANSTRYSPTTLLYAHLVYSNWLTETDEYHLSWHLVTSKGSYVVDCVTNTHKCDTYEW